MASRKPLVIVSGAVSELPTGDDLAGYAKAGPSFSAYMSAAQTLTSGVFTKLNYDTARFDTHGCYDTTNKRFTPGVAGRLVVSTVVDYFASYLATICIASIFKNGAEALRLVDLRAPVLPSGTAYISGSAVGADSIYLGPADYIEIYAYVVATSPSINSSTSFPQLTSFSASFVGN